MCATKHLEKSNKIASVVVYLASDGRGSEWAYLLKLTAYFSLNKYFNGNEKLFNVNWVFL
jgi:hypothetical protein